MKTKKTIFVFFLVNLVFCFYAKAQVQIASTDDVRYTDVNPDVSRSTPLKLGASVYNVDVNNDGISDFQIGIGEGTRTCPESDCGTYFPIFAVTVSSFGNNQLLDMWIGGSDAYPRALNLDDAIQETSPSWVSGSFVQIMRNSVAQCGPACGLASYKGLWTSGDHYLGVKIIKNSKSYFGWIRLDVNVTLSGASFILKDYAIRNLPNVGILAGQKTGLASDALAGLKTDKAAAPFENLDNLSLKTYPNPFTNSTTVSFTLTRPEQVSLMVYDMTGKVVKVLADGFLPEGEHQIEWNATDERGNSVSAGVYSLNAVAANYSENQKVIISK
jgi:hypothetical protein